METVKIVERTIRVKTYHPMRGDSLIVGTVTARSDRPKTDPFFATAAKKLARGHGRVVEYKVDMP